MKRWLPWFVVSLIFAFWTIAIHPKDPRLLQDSDTKEIVRVIRETQNPWTWFMGDWPLYNHFYRPISTLTFEWDVWIHGTNAAGFGLTNAILGALSILALFWLVREISDSPLLTGLSVTLFGLWHTGSLGLELVSGLLWLAAFGVWFLLFRGGKEKFWTVALASFCLAYLAMSLAPPGPELFTQRILGWLPGRTASTMTVFALVALAAYARYERLTARTRSLKEATSRDLPATKGTALPDRGRAPWIWIGVTFLGLALALGSYEQAVMVPGCLFAIAVIFFTKGRKPHWLLHFGFWIVLGGYLALRLAILPRETSGYQDQQLRYSWGAWQSILEYPLPMVADLGQLAIHASAGFFILLTGAPYVALASVIANGAAHLGTWLDRERWPVFGWLALATLAYLPMAFLKFFGHYLYWPSALWAPYAVTLGVVTFRLVISAASLPEKSAPPRSRPAPGSLLHP
ncbi:MAG: hypothetical protein MUC92_08215 [Fimbriimonadaceae bacterium]|jgi:hypothetical protein|nr:hypothetical protein [Fimbriimonadaceae bacterium]